MNTRRTEKAAETRPRREHDAPLKTKTAPNGAVSALDVELDVELDYWKPETSASKYSPMHSTTQSGFL